MYDLIVPQQTAVAQPLTVAQVAAQLAADNPALAQVLRRGAEIVRGGGVQQDTWASWVVRDNRTRRPHRVTFLQAWACDCGAQNDAQPMHEFCGGVQPVCAHVAAAALHWAAGCNTGATLEVR